MRNARLARKRGAFSAPSPDQYSGEEEQEEEQDHLNETQFDSRSNLITVPEFESSLAAEPLELNSVSECSIDHSSPPGFSHSCLSSNFHWYEKLCNVQPEDTRVPNISCTSENNMPNALSSSFASSIVPDWNEANSELKPTDFPELESWSVQSPKWTHMGLDGELQPEELVMDYCPSPPTLSLDNVEETAIKRNNGMLSARTPDSAMYMKYLCMSPATSITPFHCKPTMSWNSKEGVNIDYSSVSVISGNKADREVQTPGLLTSLIAFDNSGNKESYGNVFNKMFERGLVPEHNSLPPLAMPGSNFLKTQPDDVMEAKTIPSLLDPCEKDNHTSYSFDMKYSTKPTCCNSHAVDNGSARYSQFLDPLGNINKNIMSGTNNMNHMYMDHIVNSMGNMNNSMNTVSNLNVMNNMNNMNNIDNNNNNNNNNMNIMSSMDSVNNMNIMNNVNNFSDMNNMSIMNNMHNMSTMNTMPLVVEPEYVPTNVQKKLYEVRSPLPFLLQDGTSPDIQSCLDGTKLAELQCRLNRLEQRQLLETCGPHYHQMLSREILNYKARLDAVSNCECQDVDCIPNYAATEEESTPIEPQVLHEGLESQTAITELQSGLNRSLSEIISPCERKLFSAGITVSRDGRDESLDLFTRLLASIHPMQQLLIRIANLSERKKSSKKRYADTIWEIISSAPSNTRYPRSKDCPKCVFSDCIHSVLGFWNGAELVKHIAAHHSTRKMLTCEFCYRRFGRRVTLVKHQDENHFENKLAARNEPEQDLNDFVRSGFALLPDSLIIAVKSAWAIQELAEKNTSVDPDWAYQAGECSSSEDESDLGSDAFDNDLFSDSELEDVLCDAADPPWTPSYTCDVGHDEVHESDDEFDSRTSSRSDDESEFNDVVNEIVTMYSEAEIAEPRLKVTDVAGYSMTEEDEYDFDWMYGKPEHTKPEDQDLVRAGINASLLNDSMKASLRMEMIASKAMNEYLFSNKFGPGPVRDLLARSSRPAIANINIEDHHMLVQRNGLRRGVQSIRQVHVRKYMSQYVPPRAIETL